jgi:mono/diheme cytochrome c family protein
MLRIGFKYGVGVICITLLSSCFKSKQSPGYEYMPDMYRSEAFRPGEPNPNFPDSTTNQMPVAGTIAHSFDRTKIMNNMPYPYPDNEEGRARAGAELRNPLNRTEQNLAEGKRLFGLYCEVCHGANGLGDGPITGISPVLKPFEYNSENLRNAPEGQLFHATQFGKNNMGSYATQLSVEQRWKVVMYVQELQKYTVAESKKASSDSISNTP